MGKVFDFAKFCTDFSIGIADESVKQYRDGWINVSCPFCGRLDKYFLGFEEDTGRLSCWQCGWKRTIDVVAKLANVSKGKAWHLVSQYSGFILKRKKKNKQCAEYCKLPPHQPLSSKHYKHLASRGISKEMLEPYQPVAAEPVGPYKHRIIFPIYFHGTLVSYQGYDWTRRSKMKYKACPLVGEVVPHQEIFFGLDLVPSNKVVVVEGVMDAIKLGPGAICCFGISWTKEQANLLKQFEEVFIMFDSEVEAQRQARRLAKAIYIPGRLSPELIELDEAADPGDLTPEQADKIMKELGVK